MSAGESLEELAAQAERSRLEAIIAAAQVEEAAEEAAKRAPREPVWRTELAASRAILRGEKP